MRFYQPKSVDRFARDSFTFICRTNNQTIRSSPISSHHREAVTDQTAGGGEPPATARCGRRQPFSRHDGFFTSLQRVEDRLATEQHQEQRRNPEQPPPATAAAAATTRQPEPAPFSDTMATASTLVLLLDLDPLLLPPRERRRVKGREREARRCGSGSLRG